MNKITELKLTFDEGIGEQELLNKGFEKLIINEYELFKFKKNGLTVYYNNKNVRDVSWIELVIYIDEGEVVRYENAKEFNLVDGVKLLKDLGMNICKYVEIHGLGDIRQKLVAQDSRWNEPDWLKGSMLYIDENSGYSYHQENGFYRMCVEFDGNEINICECL